MSVNDIQRYLLLFGLLLGGTGLLAQETDFDQLLQRVDTVENPVYKPMITASYGVLDFLGDVRNPSILPVTGNAAAKLTVTTFLDRSHNFTLNFSFLTGTLTGNQRSFTDLSKNLNFRSTIYTIGVSSRYEFGHLIPESLKFRPYVGLGIEQVNFDTKGDLFDREGNLYHYWTDGTIRSIPEGALGSALPLQRDFVYETDLRSYEQSTYGLGDYAPRSIGFPVEVGVALKISNRIAFLMGTAYHFTLSDKIDNVAASGTHHVGRGMTDGYLFSHASIQFDMFSDPETRTVDLLFADVDLDPMLFDDEDGDFVLDIADACPGTPYGVAVDTLGCPLDTDGDGVPDYLDKEADTPEGVWVDDNGVTLSEERHLAELQRDSALKRDDLEAYMRMFEATFESPQVLEIPEKYRSLDSDEDGYISYDELLRVIDDYFDFKVNLSIEELREVNEFFFSQ